LFYLHASALSLIFRKLSIEVPLRFDGILDHMRLPRFGFNNQSVGEFFQILPSQVGEKSAEIEKFTVEDE
jgi:hypothetical protein